MSNRFAGIVRVIRHITSGDWVGWDLDGNFKRGHFEFFDHHRRFGLKLWIVAQIIIHLYLYLDGVYHRNDQDFVAVCVIILVPLGGMFLMSLVAVPYQLGWSRGYHRGYYVRDREGDQ